MVLLLSSAFLLMSLLGISTAAPRMELRAVPTISVPPVNIRLRTRLPEAAGAAPERGRGGDAGGMTNSIPSSTSSHGDKAAGFKAFDSFIRGISLQRMGWFIPVAAHCPRRAGWIDRRELVPRVPSPRPGREYIACL